MSDLEDQIDSELLKEGLKKPRTMRDEVSDVLLKLYRATNGRDEKLAEALVFFASAVGCGTEEQIRRMAQVPNLPKDIAKLPVYNIYELADDYRRFVKTQSHRRYDICRWLPGLRVRPLVPGEIVVIVSDTGVGKTTLAMNLARHAAPLSVVMFQLELPRTLVFERYVSMQTKVDGEDIHRAFHDDVALDWKPTELEHIWTCDRSGLTADEIGELIVNSRSLMAIEPAIVIVDYIGLVGGRGERYSRVSDAVEKFKVIAKNTNTVFVVISQVSRPDNKEAAVEPKLHSAKESGSIENSGGLVLAIWRDVEDSNKLWVKVNKNSKGKGGRKICCQIDFPSMRITEIVDEKELM